MYLHCVYCEQVVRLGSTVRECKFENMLFSSVVRECDIILPVRPAESSHPRLNP